MTADKQGVIEMAKFYYVDNFYGTAGMGQSFGYAQVTESDEELDTFSDQTSSRNGPFATEAEAQAQADKDNAEWHDPYRATHE
jgi:hypothetical protein